MQPIGDLKLTAKRQEICTKLGFVSVDDILHYYPSRYDVNFLNKREDYIKGARICFKGEITMTPVFYHFAKARSVVRFKCLNQNGDEINCTIFNRPWAKNLKKGQKLVVIGTVEGQNRINVINYYLNKDPKEVLGIIPVYALKEDVTQKDIKGLINAVLVKMKGKIKDTLPEDLKKTHHLIDREEALRAIHHPSDIEMYKKALSRLKYEEFLTFYLALYLKDGPQAKKQAKVFDIEKINELIASLKFTLTKDQLQTIKEILIDLKSSEVMTRLVQGDVGSGKTIVAMIALYANYLSGYMGAFMAPTEILAKQHFENIKELLGPLGVKSELLCSSTKNKKEIMAKLQRKEIDILVGTHALFSEDVKIKDLGLVITDEQQRFGVNQRRKLLAKGENVDFLLMSATPIPRTLASALYGDMAISSIVSMPEGRKGADTFLLMENSIKTIIPELFAILKEGRQIYIIASAIDKNASGTIDATSIFEECKEVFKPYEVGLLHGKLTSQEKEQVMADFANNRIQILVTTTVVEVGVNVKNATCMVVYNAERFGLSQLHQLRGRIQRSIYRGKFYMLVDDPGDDVQRRLKVLVDTNDGFKIAQEDLKLRGPGDLLGTRQSGLPSFILGNILTDRVFIEAAQKDARLIIAKSQDKRYKDILAKVQESIQDSLIKGV